jgi:hypothetical protein
MQVNAIDPAKTAMIVVDMQNDFVATGAPMETPAARAMVPKIAEALKLPQRCNPGDLHSPCASPRWLRYGFVRRHAPADR